MSPLLKGALSTGGSRNDLVWLPLTLFYSVRFMHHLDPHTCPRVACSPGAWLLQLYLLQTQGPGLRPLFQSLGCHTATYGVFCHPWHTAGIILCSVGAVRAVLLVGCLAASLASSY